MRINLTFVSIVAGAAIGYIIQPTLVSAIVGGVVGLAASLVFGLLLAVIVFALAWVASR